MNIESLRRGNAAVKVIGILISALMLVIVMSVQFILAATLTLGRFSINNASGATTPIDL